MKALLFLLVLSLGCAGVPKDGFPMLETYNSSGAPVRVYGAQNGYSFQLGQSWPGKDCFRIGYEVGDRMKFGIKHLGQKEVWMSEYIELPRNGVKLNIGQPLSAKVNLHMISPGARC